MAKKADETHHICPTSRGGEDTNSNTCKIPSKFHSALHYFFHNMTEEEQVKFVQEFNRIAKKVKELDGRDLYDLRQSIKDGPTAANKDFNPGQIEFDY